MANKNNSNGNNNDNVSQILDVIKTTADAGKKILDLWTKHKKNKKSR
ncbi:MAG: hypothetical protein Q4C30_06600 [Bacteroidia bacterium]|nr:hypothetical protein [Bacteroidia bacterium]